MSISIASLREGDYSGALPISVRQKLCIRLI